MPPSQPDGYAGSSPVIIAPKWKFSVCSATKTLVSVPTCFVGLSEHWTSMPLLMYHFNRARTLPGIRSGDNGATNWKA